MPLRIRCLKRLAEPVLSLWCGRLFEQVPSRQLDSKPRRHPYPAEIAPGRINEEQRPEIGSFVLADKKKARGLIREPFSNGAALQVFPRPALADAAAAEPDGAEPRQPVVAVPDGAAPHVARLAEVVPRAVVRRAELPAAVEVELLGVAARHVAVRCAELLAAGQPGVLARHGAQRPVAPPDGERRAALLAPAARPFGEAPREVRQPETMVVPRGRDEPAAWLCPPLLEATRAKHGWAQPRDAGALPLAVPALRLAQHHLDGPDRVRRLGADAGLRHAGAPVRLAA